MKLKNRAFQIINKAEEGDRASRAFDIGIIALIALSVLSIVLQSFDALALRFQNGFAIFEAFTVAVFSLEYLARIWTADLLYPQAKHPRLRYVFSFMALVDLLAILPFYVPFISIDLRFLRLLRLFRLTRLLRLFKLGRYLDSLQMIADVMKKSARQLIAAMGACLLILLLSAILMYSLEKPVQPDAFPNIMAALWWAVCTLTTVGYGDVFPITAAGKLLASLISIVGIGIVAIPTGIISAGFTQAMSSRRKEPANAPNETPEQKRFCAYCGHELD